MPIQLLPPQLANQIAAGEVVERPASVVKELVENSLDAGATRIELDIEKGGHKRIRLRDNGSGIGKDELALALSRHATSKIATLDDLESILSLGFRGEALASISSVSRLILTSKPETQEQAWQAHCEGRDMQVSLNPVAHPQGTTIDVADLFYNTPARRKFLRTEKTEYQHIEDVIRRIALSHPEVSFILKHNGKVTKRYQASSSDQLPQRIAAVMGQKFLTNAIHVQTDYHGMQMEAWLGNEAMLRSSTDGQFSFVNGRGMRDKLILHAIRQAYESVWGVLEQPSFVVYLTVDPRDVDVNVHPAKHEVRFQQSRLVHDFICKTVTDALCDGEENGSTTFDEPEHDYIRPLAPVAAPAAPAFDHRQAGAPAADPNANGVARHPVGNTGNKLTRYPTSGGGGARPSVGDYTQSYTALLTPQGDISHADCLHYLQINEYIRIYCHKNSCLLLPINAIIGDWIERNVSAAGASQPLLMPVSVADDGTISQQTVDMLRNGFFEINHVAGKYRLQQVPAGCRHFPWVNWFPQMLASQQSSLNGVLKSVSNNETLPGDILNAVWHDFDQQAEADKVATLEARGRRQSVESLIEKWPE